MGERVVPASVRLGPHLIEIRSDAETSTLLAEEASRGDSRADRHLIRIDATRPHTGVAETLLHELIHAAWNQTPLRQITNLDENEELIATALAPLLLALLRDNPHLVGYLTA